MSKDSGFTRFLRNLEPGRPLDRESREFDEAWAGLRRLLVGELKRRSLWTLPPAFLGIYGCTSWTDPEAIEELVAECFVFTFAERFRTLKAQLRSKADIDGLVLRNVRNFLQETQRQHDPVGFRVFTVLRSAVRNLLTNGELQVIAGSPSVQRGTVLAFRTASSEEETARLDDLRLHVLAWNDDLLPGLITARGWDVRQVTGRLEKHLRRLETAGIRAFRFHDLVDALRQDARARWRAVWVCSPDGIPPQPEEEDGLAAVTRLVEPPSAWDERENVHELLACLERSVERVPEPPARTRDYLRRLLAFLKSHATDSPDETRGEELPSHRQLATLLDIPRDRMPGLFRTLLDLAQACRRRLSGEESP